MRAAKETLQLNSNKNLPFIKTHLDKSFFGGKEIGKTDKKTNKLDDLISIFRNKDNSNSNNEEEFSINKEIEYSEQGSIGDCWLLSGLNSLSYTEKGREIIKNAITKTPDGYRVKFKGVNTTIEVTNEDMEKAEVTQLFSQGDDDALLMEIAFMKVMDKIKDKEIDAPLSLYRRAINGSTSIDGGELDDVIYLLTGNNATDKKNYEFVGNNKNISQKIINKIKSLFDKFTGNSWENVFDKIEKNPENIAAVISFNSGKENENAYIYDVNGKEVKLTNGGSHAWSVKSVDGNTVTLVNPWDSSIETVVYKSELEKYTRYISYYEL